MTEPNDLLVANLIAALQQLQQYIVIALGASVSALALTTKTVSQDRITVPGTSVAVDPNTASLILLALCVLSGAMASYAAETVNVIAKRLDSTTLTAACTFPSVGTSPYIGVRTLAALVPLIFSMAAIIRSARPHGKKGRMSILGWFIFLGPAFGYLALALIKSNCLAR